MWRRQRARYGWHYPGEPGGMPRRSNARGVLGLRELLLRGRGIGFFPPRWARLLHSWPASPEAGQAGPRKDPGVPGSLRHESGLLPLPRTPLRGQRPLRAVAATVGPWRSLGQGGGDQGQAGGALGSEARKALDLASRLHRGQPRDDGLSYLREHVFPVTLRVVDYLEDKL